MADSQPAGLRSLLAANTSFRSLWLARLFSFLGDSVGLIALLLYTAGRYGSGLAVALLMIAGDFVPGLLSPVAGAVSDRWDRRLVMVSCEVAQGAIIAVVALTLPPLPVLLLLVAAQACVAAVFQPASRSVVPALVPGADLERANAAIGFGTNGMDSAGPLVGAALLAWLSVRDLLLTDVATFVISAGLLLTLPALVARAGPASNGPAPGQTAANAPAPGQTAGETTPGDTTARGTNARGTNARGTNARGTTAGEATARERAGPRALLADARTGLGYLWQDRVLRVVTLAFCAVVLFNGVDDVALVFLARHTLHGSESAASLVYAGAGLGLLAGFLLLARAGARVAMPVLILAGYAVSSLGNLLTGLSFAILAALAFQVIRGLGIAGMDVGHNTLIQRRVPAAMLGRVFGNVYGAVGAAAGLSYVFGGLLLDATNPRVTLIVAGAGGLAAAAVAAIALPRALRPPDDRRGPAEPTR